MTRIATLWSGLDPRGRLVALLAAGAVALAVIGLARVAVQPGMALLYAGLDAAAAGGVVSALEARQVPYEVRGDAIYVPDGERDALRMTLAAEGRPEGGAAGYELLDDLSGFGTTSEMFDAAYWRAKEGELARTILALPQVRSARVHVANPQRRPFERGGEPTASVAVSMSSGALPARQAEAVRFLVAAAVPGLSPEGVTVIDAEKGLAIADGSADDPARGTQERAERLKANVERLLAARVGPESVVVEVTVDADMNSETVRERVLDPEGRVAVHSDVQESAANSEGGPGSGVTVASNLPDGDAGGEPGGGAKSSSTETRERMNYEVSEVVRERVRLPGEIRRIGVAVLVDGVTAPGPNGAPVWEPRPEAELEALRALVESAVGYDAARGDVITIRSLRFAEAAELGVTVEQGAGDFLRANAATLLQMAILAGVALLLGLFVLRPLLTRRPEPLALEGRAAFEALEGPEAIEAQIAAAGEALSADGVDRDRMEALRHAAEERSEAAAALLAAWLDADRGKGERA
ncbi:MAG TPA: flagellar basal-body MS-ring/collar protein FliF [Paracoccaceae bacterium]|nr:flagellar basal-body MS-ring/collar protein FliF [Paracoccaceae bacterium]